MTSDLSRYTRILYKFWVTSLACELEYKVNFFVELISVFGNLFGSIFILSIFYNRNNNLGGWNWYSALIILGIYCLLEAFIISILQPNLSRIVKHVQNGTLDFILLKPINPQFWLSTRMITPWGFPSFLAGLVLIIIGSLNQNIEIKINDISVSLALLFSSLVILYSLWFVIATTSIWFVKVWNANEVLRSFLVVGRYPITAFPVFLRTIFTFILPIAFLTTVPAEALIGNSNGLTIFISFSLALIFFMASNLFWNYAIGFYTSASS